jgi:hypothetical protein|tara:strand:+ start:10 stop:615 length:606 start_codon:yes stop_codon:yes gene_type:complete
MHSGESKFRIVMRGIKVIDDCIPFELQNQIEKLIQNSDMRFAYGESTNDHQSNNSEYQDGNQLVNKFIQDGKFIVGDTSHFFLLPLQIVCLQEKFNFNLGQVIRAKINLKFKQESKLNKFINPPHIDNTIPNTLIGIYYINDSDGDTIIYEGNDENNLKILESIEPKKGRMILMDGSTWHSASHPLKTNKRMVINYNIVLQ